MKAIDRFPSGFPGYPLGLLGGVLIYLCWGFHASGAQNLLRGPYLQRATQTNLVVRWRTSVPSESFVAYGTNPIRLDLSVENSSLTTNHTVVLPELQPDTRYYYAIGSPSDILAWGPGYQFRTAPAVARPFRIWAIGDSGTASAGNFGSHLVRDAYYEIGGVEDTDVWLMLGDNAYSTGTDAQYQTAVFETYQEMLYRVPLWSTIGNHETFSADINGFFAYLDIFNLPERGEAGGVPSGTPRYYSFDYGNAHFVCLDSESSSRGPTSPQLKWLEQDLEANTNDWLIAFWHTPPYSKGSHDSDREANLIIMRTNVVPVLEAHGVDLVLCGHSHNYERSYLMNGHYGFSSDLEPGMILDSGSGRTNQSGAYLKSAAGPAPNQGTVYVVAGSSGWATFTTGRHPAMFEQILAIGSLIIDIDGNRLDARFLRETGAVDDYFTILKGVETSPFKIIEYNLGNGTDVLTWNSKPGEQYQVQQTGQLEPLNWVTLDSMIFSQGTTTTWTNLTPNPGPSSYYRVRWVEH